MPTGPPTRSAAARPPVRRMPTLTTANDGNATHLIRASVAPVTGARSDTRGSGARPGAEVLGGHHLRWPPPRSAPHGHRHADRGLARRRRTIPSTRSPSMDCSRRRWKPGSGATVLGAAAGPCRPGHGRSPPTMPAASSRSTRCSRRCGTSYRLSPDTIWVSSQEALNISRKIVSGAAASAQRFVFDSHRRPRRRRHHGAHLLSTVSQCRAAACSTSRCIPTCRPARC